MSTQIKITNRIPESLFLNADPLLFSDTDASAAGEIYNLELVYRNSDFDCEFDNCEHDSESDLPVATISFLDFSPVQSIRTDCLSHYPDFVSVILKLIK